MLFRSYVRHLQRRRPEPLSRRGRAGRRTARGDAPGHGRRRQGRDRTEKQFLDLDERPAQLAAPVLLEMDAVGGEPVRERLLVPGRPAPAARSEENTSELKALMRTSDADISLTET